MIHPDSQPYQSTAAFISKTSSIPAEPLLKLIASVIGIVGEAVTGFDTNWNYDNIQNNFQHMLMFFYYAINAIADLAVFYKVRYIPPNIDYLSAILAIFNEGFLFANHLHGRKMLDIKLHMCLVYSITACVLASIIELVMDKTDVRPAIFRCVCYLWHGTWFYHIAFVLYPPFGIQKWDEDSHANVMITVLFFMLHLAFNFIVVILIGVAVYFQERKASPAKYKPISTNGHANGIPKPYSDNEEEELFMNSC